MNSVTEFQINEVGVSNGMVIPSGFRIVIEHAIIRGVQGDPDKDHILEVQAVTFIDDNYIEPVENDGLEAQGFSGTVRNYDDPDFAGANNFKVVVAALVKADLDNIYDPANVVEV